MTDREHDPGFYLVGNGRRAFEAELQIQAPSQSPIPARHYIHAGLPGYLASIFLITAIVLFLALWAEVRLGLDQVGTIILGLLSHDPPHRNSASHS